MRPSQRGTEKRRVGQRLGPRRQRDTTALVCAPPHPPALPVSRFTMLGRQIITACPKGKAIAFSARGRSHLCALLFACTGRGTRLNQREPLGRSGQGAINDGRHPGACWAAGATGHRCAGTCYPGNLPSTTQGPRLI